MILLHDVLLRILSLIFHISSLTLILIQTFLNFLYSGRPVFLPLQFHHLFHLSHLFIDPPPPGFLNQPLTIDPRSHTLLPQHLKLLLCNVSPLQTLSRRNHKRSPLNSSLRDSLISYLISTMSSPSDFPSRLLHHSLSPCELPEHHAPLRLITCMVPVPLLHIVVDDVGAGTEAVEGERGHIVV